jgi:hypothetical protein
MKPSTLKIGEEVFTADTKPQTQAIRINAEVFGSLAGILGLEKNEKDGKWQRGSSDAVSKFVGRIVGELETSGKVDLAILKEEVAQATPQAEAQKTDANKTTAQKTDAEKANAQKTDATKTNTPKPNKA